MTTTHQDLLQDVEVPYMGSVENAVILNWKIAEGEPVEPGMVLCEIETDKTVLDIESPGSGILVKQLLAAGETLKVGTRIGFLAPASAPADQVQAALRQASGVSEYAAAPAAEPEPSSHRPNAAPSASGTASAPAPAVTASSKATTTHLAGSTPQRSSPYARRLAKEHGIDLSLVAPSGPSGRITGDDVLRAVSARKVIGAVSTPQIAPRPDGDAPASSDTTLPGGYQGIAHQRVPHSNRRKTIARRMAQAASTVPHVTADVQADVTRLLKARKHINSQRSTQGLEPVSVLALVARATCMTLRDHRALNATFTDDAALLWEPINLGIAVDSPDGLMVPVIRNAENLNAAELTAAIRDLASRAREGSLKVTDMEGGTFTISNPGSTGPVLRAEAILNVPQVALLGLTAIQQTPTAIEKEDGEYEVQVRPIMRLSLTFDHRAIDGGPVIRFMVDLKNRLESMVLMDW